MITYEDKNGVVDLSIPDERPSSVKVILNEDLTVGPHEKCYVTLNMQVSGSTDGVIFIGESYDDSHDEEYWFLYTEVQPDNINHKIVLLNFTDETLNLKKGDQLGIIIPYRIYVEEDTPTQYGEIVYSLRGLNIFDKDGTAKDIKYSMSGQEEQILIKL